MTAVYRVQTITASAAITVKSGLKSVPQATLPESVEKLLTICLETLPVNLQIVTTIQISRAKNRHHRKSLRGIMTYVGGSNPSGYMTLYTWPNPELSYFLDTLAHEIGHFHHYITAQNSQTWTHHSKETYATWYAQQQLMTFQRTHPMTPTDKMKYLRLRNLVL